MTKAGKHPDKALTALAVRAMKLPGRYADGNGLYLVVDPSGAKRWLLRVVIKGKRRDIGLGGLTLVSLAEAREQALAYRKIARAGGDPLANRKPPEKLLTFKEAAEKAHCEHKVAWRNAKHVDQWINTLKAYAYPDLGSLPVAEIGSPDIVKSLSAIWTSKPETARRVKQRIGTVLDWAQANGHRTAENPIKGVHRGLAKQTERVQHHSALPYKEHPQFLILLKTEAGASELTRLALEFLIRTACRTGEVLGARWSEIDEFDSLWVVPSHRMKANREHRVPLSKRCLEILSRAKQLGAGSEFVFPGRSITRSMSNMAYTMLMRRLDVPYTVHGFRSSFRDWASECTEFSSDVCEMALAHIIKNKVEAAYRRGDLLDRRRKLMSEWEEYLNGISEQPN